MIFFLFLSFLFLWLIVLIIQSFLNSRPFILHLKFWHILFKLKALPLLFLWTVLQRAQSSLSKSNIHWNQWSLQISESFFTSQSRAHYWYWKINDSHTVWSSLVGINGNFQQIPVNLDFRNNICLPLLNTGAAFQIPKSTERSS